MDKIFIYGIPSGGLFGLRQLRKQYPSSTIYVFAPKTDIGYYSNKYDKFIEVSAREQMYEKTLAAYYEIGKGEVYAFVYSNRLLEYLVDGNHSLFDLLIFENPYEVYRTIVDKKCADSLCRNLGLHRPEEYMFDDQYAEASYKYPIVVKPLEKQKAIGASKCKFIANALEYDTYVKFLRTRNIDIDNLVCQQAVVGDNEYEYGYGGYFKAGKTVVDICFYQFRQVPQGLSCYIREISDVAIAKRLRLMVEPFLIHLKYTGFIEFDIKQDAQSGELYVLDINPRPWGSSDMLNVKLGSSTVYEPVFSEKKVVWRKPFEELFSFSNPRNTSYFKCKQITGTKGYYSSLYLYDKSDMKPYLMNLYKNIIKYLYTKKQIIKSWLHKHF